MSVILITISIIIVYYRGEAVDVFLHEDAVYGLAVDPRNDNIYASACADGRVLLWDIRAPSHHGMQR